MKKLIIVLSLLLLAAFAFGQSETAPIVSNVAATPSAGQVTITYNLTAAGVCDVTLMVSNNNGVTYNIYPTAVTGAIGNSVSNSPVAKTIIWHPAGDNMAIGANYKVKVIARNNPVENTTQFQSFINVAGGTFNNGVSNVTVSSFYLDKFEVTQAEYQAVMGSNPAHNYGVGSNYPVYYVSWFNAIEYSNRRSMQEGLLPCYSYSTYGTNPATWPVGWNSNYNNHTNVSCNWTANGYRLPTEAEWEFAARGGNSTHNYTYSGSEDINAVAWWNGNSSYTSHTVGTKTANELGLFDMSGNVWEWNWDIYGTYASGAQTNPHGVVSGSTRVDRGGSFANGASTCAVSFRYSSNATQSDNALGFRICRSLYNFIRVEGGTFNNGTSDVTVSSFYLDKFELTQAEYQAVMGVNPSYWQQTDRPVEQVSWFNAIEYCNRRSISESLTPCYSYSTFGTNPTNWPAGWNTSYTNHTNVTCNWTATGYRLPTEAEWQFAARGGNSTHSYTYSGSEDINAVAWYLDNSSSTTHTVGTKTANELGLFDMTGNVWEWNWDIYGYPSGAQTNPHGVVGGSDRVVRGGSWTNDAYPCTVSYRTHTDATFSINTLGFRLCRVVP